RALGPPLCPGAGRGPILTTYNYCDMCPWRCGIIVRSVNGKVVKIDGNPADPKSRGMLCARGQAGVSFNHDPNRLTKPLIRTGPRGTWEFREASWEEALDLIVQKMTTIKDAYGQESVAFIGHTSGDFWFTDHFAQAWGSPNAAKPSMSLCTSPREEAALLTFGRAIGNHEPVDWDQIRAVALIGGHIGEDSRNTLMQDFANTVARGAEVIVVDPRFSTAAMKATQWLPIKPGTDTALLLAWINVLIGEKLYDAEFVAQWTLGFAALAAHVREFTPEWAAAITDLPADAIRSSARALGNARPQAAIMPGRHSRLVRQRHPAHAGGLYRQCLAGRVWPARRRVFQQSALHRGVPARTLRGGRRGRWLRIGPRRGGRVASRTHWKNPCRRRA
ncbi:MAG: molybdopterin-dependent oxidoreductase, partial [Oscillochloris sp.]|nr:molybdopterin-dependent oxidoreductase [Oscillochloris sp.]